MVKRMRSFFAVVMLVIAAAVNAQVTTSSMSGKVVDQSNEAIIYKPQNKMFHFCKTFCSKITLVNTIQNVI